jgi:hypothetical protein
MFFLAGLLIAFGLILLIIPATLAIDALLGAPWFQPRTPWFRKVVYLVTPATLGLVLVLGGGAIVDHLEAKNSDEQAGNAQA